MVEQRLSEIHITRARSKALRLFAFASSVYPVEWAPAYVEEIVEDLLEFGYHARRVNQICNIDVEKIANIDRFIVKISEGGPTNWLKSYKEALDYIAHAETFVFGSAHSDHRQIFLQSRANLTPLYVAISTDSRAVASISLYGLVDGFLTNAISQLKTKHPNFIF